MAASSSSVFGNVTFYKFRRMFMIAAPWESYYKTVEDVPDFVNESLPFFTILIFIEILVSQLRGLHTHRFNDCISSLSAGVISQLAGMVIIDTVLEFYIWVYDNFHVIDLAWDSAWTWILAFLVVDFSYYWFHRATHDVNILWAGHQAHHSSEEYNLTTALRQGVIQKYTSFLFYSPAALFIPPSIFLVHSHFNLIYQFWVHTELVGKLGPLEYILSTPSSHRVHHGINQLYYHSNYGGTLIIWDRIFGTYAPESVPPRYGLRQQLGTFSPLWGQLNHIWKIVTTIKSVDGWRNKLSVLVKRPGWYPWRSQQRPSNQIKKVDLSKPKFGNSQSLFVNVYILTHFVMILFMYFELINYLGNIAQLPLIGCILFLIFTLQCIGYMCDHRWFAAYVEILRCSVFIGVYLFQNPLPLPLSRGYQYLPISVHVSMCIHVLSLMVWTVVGLRGKI